MSMDAVSLQKATPDQPTSFRLVSFSATNFGKSGFWAMADIFCLVYATDTLGVEPALAGTIILLTLVWDAVSDPVAGALVDRFQSLNRSYGTLIRWASPFCALFLVLIFSVHLLPAGLHILAFGIFLLLFRSAFTLIDIPDNALFARIARTRQQRLFAASARKIMATLAAVIVSGATAWIFSDSAALSEGQRILIAICWAAPVAALALWSGTKSVCRWDHAPSDKGMVARKISFRYLSDASVLALTAHMFLSTLGMSVFMSALVYHARFVLGNDAWFATAMTVLLVAQAFGVVFWSALAARIPTHTAILVSVCVSVASIVLFFSASSQFMMLAGCAAFGSCAGGLNTLRWALASGVIDEASGNSGQRDEAMIMALFSLSIKSAIGLASLAVGVALTCSGFEAGGKASGIQAASFSGTIAFLAITALILAIVPTRNAAIKKL